MSFDNIFILTGQGLMKFSEPCTISFLVWRKFSFIIGDVFPSLDRNIIFNFPPKTFFEIGDKHQVNDLFKHKYKWQKCGHYNKIFFTMLLNSGLLNLIFFSDLKTNNFMSWIKCWLHNQTQPVGDFLRVLQFPPPIKLTITI